MTTDSRPSADEVPVEVARQELERLLQDGRFHAAKRNRAFLRYICEEQFAGRSNRLKAYCIAVDVFGRPADFNSSADPIVRIEANRLRSALDNYYRAFGSVGDVRLHIPKGRYVPVFTRTCHLPEDAHDPSYAEGAFEQPHQERQERGTRQWRLATLLTAAAGCVICAVGAWMYQRPVFIEKPIVAVRMMTLTADGSPQALAVYDQFMAALAGYRSLRVAASADEHDEAARWSPWRTTAVNRYAIDLKFYSASSGQNIWWQVSRPGSGDIIETGVQTANRLLDPDQVQQMLVLPLVRKLASLRGVINGAEMRDESSSLGNGCLLRAEYALDSMRTDRFDVAKTCLRSTLTSRPDDADSEAALSRLIVAQQLGRPEPAGMGEALSLARSAGRLHRIPIVPTYR
ncbi:hypothetical protein [Rhizobium leguminosarum]|uniref:hypothetical protein n=1 Tax=Rhizobium leguminosarum TaxID=384 RepID=UPI001AE2828C|nr:hypothetical protein [Rhizobium leguminosarum]MBP2444537.1 hypothetical protein [Rhizobium leguminosarum]